MKSSLNLKFSPLGFKEQNFNRTLKSRINKYLKSQNAEGGHRLNTVALMRSFIFISTYFITWTYLVFYSTNIYNALIACLMLGIVGVGIALNVGHEASHSIFSNRYRLINSALYWFSMNILGTYSYLWKIGHLQTHHKYVNVPGREVGIDGGNAIRLNSHTPFLKLHRYQHLYAPLLYCFYTFMWVMLKDWRMLYQGEQAQVKFRNTLMHFLELAFIKALYFFYMLYLPISYSSFSATEVISGFFFIHVVFSLYLASLLFTSHLNMKASFHTPNRKNELPKDFITHHLESTVDVNPDSKILSFLLGGFNTHAIHHLYPNVSATYYPEMTKILEKTAREYDMPYMKMGYIEAIKSHLSYLKFMGMKNTIQDKKHNRELAWQS